MTDNDDNLKAQADSLQQEVAAAQKDIFKRDLTSTEFYYLLSRYPYLEICDSDYPYIDEGTVPKIHRAKNGWKIYDYGSVLASGCYELLGYLYGEEVSDDEDGGGNGTIVKQYSDVAAEMIAMAKAMGWDAAEVISGFYPMQRMAWIAAQMQEYTLKGFSASIEDHVVNRWVSSLKHGNLYPPKTPIIKKPSRF